MTATISKDMTIVAPYDGSVIKYAIKFSGVTHNGKRIHGEILIHRNGVYALELFSTETGRKYAATSHKDARNEAVNMACDMFGFSRMIVMGKGERLKLNSTNSAARDRDISAVMERLGLDIRVNRDASCSDFMRSRWEIGMGTDKLEQAARGYCHKNGIPVTLPTMGAVVAHGGDIGAAHSGTVPMDEKTAAIATLIHAIANHKPGNPYSVYRGEMEQAAIACGWNDKMGMGHVEYMSAIRKSLGLGAE